MKIKLANSRREVLYKLYECLGYWPDEYELDWITLKVSEIKALFSFARAEAYKELKRKQEAEKSTLKLRPAKKFKIMDHKPRKI